MNKKPNGFGEGDEDDGRGIEKDSPQPVPEVSGEVALSGSFASETPSADYEGFGEADEHRPPRRQKK